MRRRAADLRVSFVVAALSCAGTAGLSGGAPTTDAGASPDAAPDAAGDAGAGGDAGAAGDADAAGDAGTNWCGTHAYQFCDDFDEPPFGAKWSQPVTENGGSVFLRSDASTSPPTSLEALITASDGGQSQSAQLLKAFTTHATSISCSADVLLGGYSGRNTFILGVTVSTTNGQDVYRVRVIRDPAGGSVREEGSGDGGPFEHDVLHTASLSTLGWRRVTLDVSLDPAAPNLTLTVGDDSPLQYTSSPPPGNIGQSFFVGVAHDGTGGDAADVSFDNVACDVTP